MRPIVAENQPRGTVVKILDFGLARAMAPDESSGPVSTPRSRQR
jgi:hypothetical protein